MLCYKYEQVLCVSFHFVLTHTKDGMCMHGVHLWLLLPSGSQGHLTFSRTRVESVQRENPAMVTSLYPPKSKPSLMIQFKRVQTILRRYFWYTVYYNCHYIIKKLHGCANVCVWPQLPFKYSQWQAKEEKSDFVDPVIESLNQDMINKWHCPDLQYCDQLKIHVYTGLCILRTSYKHDANREDLLGVGVGRHVAKPHAGQTAEGEVEWGDVDAADGGAVAGPVYKIVWWLQTFPQLMEPSCFNKMV